MCIATVIHRRMNTEHLRSSQRIKDVPSSDKLCNSSATFGPEISTWASATLSKAISSTINMNIISV